CRPFPPLAALCRPGGGGGRRPARAEARHLRGGALPRLGQRQPYDRQRPGAARRAPRGPPRPARDPIPAAPRRPTRYARRVRRRRAGADGSARRTRAPARARASRGGAHGPARGCAPQGGLPASCRGGIERAAPQTGEVESLEVEAKRLAHADELGRLSRELGQALDTAGLSRAAKLFAGLTRLDPSVAKWQELLDGAFAHVTELAQAARDYAAAIESDPQRLGAE